MLFVLKMTARELRASWGRLLFFFICVAIGVGAIVTLRSIIQSVRGGLVGEARAMLASDVLIQTNRAWTPEARAALEERLALAPIQARSESIETATMVRAERGDAARMVELRGVEASFPYYGSVVLLDGVPYSHELLRGRGALVRPELLSQLGVAPGDRIVIGGQPFTIRGVIAQEPGRRVGGFSFGSRVLVDLADLKEAGLLTFGSRASYQVLLKVPENAVTPLTRDVRTSLRQHFVTARSFQSTEDQIGDDLQRAENFLSLVGFVIVVLGGIGVWSVTRVFVRQKIRSVAILKCLGASTAQVLSTYVLQVALLALSGSLLGVLLAALGLRALPASLTEAIGSFTYQLTPSAVGQGLLVGLLVSLLFALVPLLDVRRVKPLLLLRGADTFQPPMTEPGPRAGAGARVRESLARADWLQIGTGVLVGAALVGVASWQAGSLSAGAAVSIGFAVVAAVLYVAALVVVRAVMPLAAAPWFPLRHAVVSLRRPGNQTRVILLAVGLGSFFVLGVRALQSNLVSEFVVDFEQNGADMFLLDIQQDQVEGVRGVIAGWEEDGTGAARLLPVLRARVTGIRGREANIDGVAGVRGRGLGREYIITYRDHLEANETLIEGQFWQAAAGGSQGGNEVSIEQRLSERAGIEIGDVMRFDILGRPLEARVTSIREVKWQDARSGGFMFVFNPAALQAAPHMYIGFLRGPEHAAARGRFQHDIVRRYPNVSVIDGKEVLTQVRKVVDSAVLAISIVGGIALVSGVLILMGAVAMTKFQRVYEAAILRTLGASTRMLTAMLALEYCALGLLAGLIGAAGALGLTWGVARHVLDIPWRPQPLLLTAGAVLTMALVGLIGVAASVDVLRKKPLATLRAE